jgi:hypothetical protein
MNGQIFFFQANGQKKKQELGKRDGNEAKHKGHQINDLQKMLALAKMRHKVLNYLRASALAHL